MKSTGWVCHFDVESGSFMCNIGTDELRGTPMLAFNTFL